MSCWMVKQRNGYVNPIRNGGGNIASDNSVIVRRDAALGDCLAATCVTDKLIEKGYSVTYQAHPGVHCLLRRLRNKVAITESSAGFAHIDLNNAYENDPQRRVKHFSQMFLDKANEQLRARNIHLGPAFNCKPHMSVSQVEKISALNKFRDYPRPWVFICPRSNTYNVRQVQDGVWEQAASGIKGTKFWLGNHGPAPPGIIDLGVRHLDNLIIWLSVADLLISVDTGPMHIAAAMGIPVIAISQSSSPELHLSDQCDYIAIAPAGLTCLNCQKLICPIHQHIPPCQNIDPKLISDWANARVGARVGNAVSAVIAVYQPDAAILNRCIESIMNQVQEIIVVRDLAGKFPQGAIQHPKIRYITKALHDLGYGKKANVGARYTNGRYLLFMNDDATLNPGAVDILKSEMRPGVGVVAPMLTFKDGRIQHAGMVRDGNGGVGFGHQDYGKHPVEENKVKREVECVTGAVVLVDRIAFYEIDGFREEYFLYCEDTDFMMAMRASGRKIIYQPQAMGLHDEHLSTGKTPDIVAKMNVSNRVFGERWARYFDHNRGRTGLGKFDYV